MPNKPNLQTVTAEEQDLRARLQTAEASLRELLSGEADGLFVEGAGGAQVFALKGADRPYRTLIENMSEGALTLTSAGLILYANRRFAQMLGTPLEKVIGSDIHTWFAPESRQVLQTLLRKDASDRRREELALAAADGTQVPVNLSVSRLKLEGMPDSFCMVATDLTEQKRNAAILAAESLARAILEQAADAIVICDGTGLILRASKQAQVLYGSNPCGQHFEHAFPLRQPDGAAFSPIGDIDTSCRQSAEARLERDGQGFDLLVSVGHLKGARNELVGSVITLTDVTERKRADQRFKDLLESAPDAMVIVNHDGKIMLVNAEAVKQFGWRREELLGQLIEMLVPERFRSEHPRKRSGFLMNAHVRPMGAELELFGLRKDGTEFPLEVSLSPLETNEGTLVISAIRDITQRKQHEQEMLASKTQLREIFDAIPDLLFELALDGRYYAYHSPRTDLLAAPPEEMLGKTVAEILPADAAEIVLAALREADTTGHSAGKQFELALPQGRLWFELSISRMEVAAGQEARFICLSRDITERKAAEVTITRLNRVYAVLSDINTLIVRVSDHDVLFKEACRIAVENGGFHSALIATSDPTGAHIVSIASAGVDEKFQSMLKDRFSMIDGKQLGSSIITRAIEGKRTVVVNDFQSYSELVFRDECAKAGIRSVAAIPLMVADKAVGVFKLYAKEIEFFQEEELKLLTELASDIAFAIDHINKQERINYLAYYDALTGLANRSLFLERAAQYMRSAESGGHKLAVILIDLERFKNINDSLGWPAGDALLKQVAEWLTRNAGDANLLARLGADYFAAVLPVVKQDGDLGRLLEKTMAAFVEHPFRLSGAIFRVAARVGVAVFPDDGADAETLFRNAEAALKKAKASGERYLFYNQTMTDAVAGKLSLENQLRQALDNEEFVLHYQPKVNLVSGKMSSAEALIRWNDPRTGLVPPGRFIPILEETGMIYDVGRWALKKAIEDYLRWRAAGLPAVRIAVNVSALQLRNRGFIEEIRQAIGIDVQAPAGLEIEITESLIMEDVKGTIASLQAIRDLGVSIAIDDFGTGFSSLSYLAKLPVDALKIDRSFVIDMTAGPEGLALVSTIIKLAHSLKLTVVAEGVETEEQARLLRLLACDEMQGFLFSKPVPAEVFEARFMTPLATE